MVLKIDCKKKDCLDLVHGLNLVIKTKQKAPLVAVSSINRNF